MVWLPHCVQPNLLTHCVLERSKLPQSALSQLYVRVAVDPAIAPPRTVPSTNTAVDTRSVEGQAHPPAASTGWITSVEELMKLGLVPLGHELQRRGLKAGGTLLQRADRLATVGGLREAAAPPEESPPEPPEPSRNAAQRPAALASGAGKRQRGTEESPSRAAPQPQPPGSGGPALRAPDPSSRRSQAKMQGVGGGDISLFE